MHSKRVLGLLALLVRFAHCFQWDIAVVEDKQLHFYYNENLTRMEELPLVKQITSVTYDPVHYRVLFADYNGTNMSISSFDMSTRKVQSLLTRKSRYGYVRVVYDPVSQLLIWGDYNIYTFSLNPACSNQAVDGNLLLAMDDWCRDVAVDSCGGYIYWTTEKEIERARFDGSEREVLIEYTVHLRPSLVIDQQTQRMYWIDNIISTSESDNTYVSIESSNLNGKNKTTLYILRNAYLASSLVVSKDYIYWLEEEKKGVYQEREEVSTWKLPKNSSENVARKLNFGPSSIIWAYHYIAANYTIEEQIQGIKSCEALRGLIPKNSKPESTVPICQNYCLEGVCSVNAEGQPTCRCKAGYSGKRCEINACHQYCLHNGACSVNEEDKPVCQCTTDYDGERCETSIRSDASNSEERKVNACHQYCLHNGVCSANEQDEPVCQCTADYDGERCETSIRSDASNSRERKVNACHQYCLHNGVCSVNEQDEPVCQCTADYEGERCEVSVSKDFYYQAACSVNAEGQPKVTVTLSTAVKTMFASNVV